MKYINTLAIEKLEGGAYNVDSVIQAIQTMFSIIGIILAISLVNLIIDLF